MPDDIATRAHLLLVVGLFAAVALMPVAAWIWRRAWRVPEGASAGIAFGLGLWSLGMLLATAEIGQWVAQVRSGVEVEGRLLGFVAQTSTVQNPGRSSPGIGSGRRLTTQAPRIEFSMPDGRRHVVLALGGSLVGLEPGDRVRLRYTPADPASATPVDFQNELGALGFFAILTTLGLLGTVYLALCALGELQRSRTAATAKKGRPPRTNASRLAVWRDGAGQRWRAPLFRAGLSSLVLAIGGAFVLALPDEADIVRVFAVALAGVAMALACFGLRAALERGADVSLVLLGRSIGVAGFGLFAAWLWALGGG